MQDSTVTVVFETESEVEAHIYEGLLRDAEIPVQLRTVADPVLTNIMRQIAFPHYEIVVPNAYATQAQTIVEEQCQSAKEATSTGEQEPHYHNPQKQAVLSIGRLLIWILLLTPLLILAFFYLLGQR